jgi:hypothetical protein
LVRRKWQGWAAGLVVLVFAGLLIVSPDPAMGQPGPRQRIRERCEAVLPQAQVDPVLAKYRDRLAGAREAAVKEERALRALLVADNSTRAAVDAQVLKTEAARSALTRVRLDMLWELRSVIPATNRAAAFRCAEFLALRRR